MLIHGGTISNGRFSTFAVDGVYWISCISAFWSTTLPGVAAMFSPSLNWVLSVMLMRSWLSPLRSRSPRRFSRPSSRLRPPVSSVARRTSGFVIAKLVGARASMYCRVKKSTFLRVFSSSPSTLVITPCVWRAASRYDCLR